jgi:endogenous inhibitor of DNA gyrase (YacG/DUF329 family)
MKAVCPICTEPRAAHEENPYYPFCSLRCQLADLGRWLNEQYCIPGEAVDVSDSEDKPMLS